MAPLERAIEPTLILAELGYEEKYSFNDLLQVTTDGNPSIGESSKVRGLWYAEAVWVNDAPGVGKLVADYLTLLLALSGRSSCITGKGLNFGVRGTGSGLGLLPPLQGGGKRQDLT